MLKSYHIVFMKIDVVTIFPKMFQGPFEESILRRAGDKGLVEINIHDLRKWTVDKRGTVDGRPYGGGVGMVMMVAPIAAAIDKLRAYPEQNRGIKSSKCKVILLSPRGKVWKQNMAVKYSRLDHLILICGHYEGVDERIKNFIDEEISIGDFILTGGEIPAMAITDSIVRLIPGVLEKPAATQNESFSSLKFKEQSSKLLLEFPQYTRPENFQGLKVPKILLSGNHEEIRKWRQKKSLEITNKLRPDLIKPSPIPSSTSQVE